MESILPKFELIPQETTVAVQGFGKAGAVIANSFTKQAIKLLLSVILKEEFTLRTG
jgi:glutamate dehydrogenase (NADP+)